MAAKVQEGKIPQATFDEWNAATDQVKLPERVTPAKVPSTLPKRKGRRR